MYLIRLLLILNIFVSVGIFAAEKKIEEIGLLLKKEPIQAVFNQQKKIKELSTTLKSSGYVWKAPDKQLVWQTQFPLKSTMVIGENLFKQYDRKDKLISTNRHAIIQHISKIFFELFNGEFSLLQKNFDINIISENQIWKVTLIPLDNSLETILEFIQVKGDTKLRHIVFKESRGDETKITLTYDQQDTKKFEKYL